MLQSIQEYNVCNELLSFCRIFWMFLVAHTLAFRCSCILHRSLAFTSANMCSIIRDAPQNLYFMSESLNTCVSFMYNINTYICKNYNEPPILSLLVCSPVSESRDKNLASPM